MLPKAVGRDSATLCREKSCRTLKTDCLNDASLVSTDRDICSEFASSVFNLSAQPEDFCAVPRLYPLILRFERSFPDDLDLSSDDQSLKLDSAFLESPTEPWSLHGPPCRR
jgi:hypothetical protein